MNELISIEERYARAAVAEHMSRGQELVMGAAGMAGTRHGLVTRLWRLVDDHDVGEYRDLVHDLAGMVRRAGSERTLAWCKGVAVEYLQWRLSPLCRTCKGRGHLPILGEAKGRDVLQDADCPECAGVGHRPVGWLSYEATQRQALADLHTRVSEAEAEASAGIRRRMR